MTIEEMLKDCDDIQLKKIAKIVATAIKTMLPKKPQKRAQTVTINLKGKVYPLALISKQVGINYQILYHRIFKLGWSEEKAVRTPPRQKVSGYNKFLSKYPKHQ